MILSLDGTILLVNLTFLTYHHRHFGGNRNSPNLPTAMLGPSRSDSGLTFDRVSQGAGRWRQEGSIFFGAEVYILLRSKYFFERSI